MKNRKSFSLPWLCTCFTLVLFSQAQAQVVNVENSIFWEVTGNELNHSSYLFGTHHLIDGKYFDSLENVVGKFNSTDAFVCEVAIDSSAMFKMIQASIMPKDTTLLSLLGNEWYDKTDNWLQEISEYPGLASFNQMAPVTVQLVIMNFLHTKVIGPTTQPLDTYIETKARSAGKEHYTLETIDESLNALFRGVSYKRQAEHLIDLVRHKDETESELIVFNQLYRNQNLSALYEMTKKIYTTRELHNLVDARNLKWISRVDNLIRANSVFIAVGALHLTGETGLVNQLRKLGYTVTPISIR